MTFWNVMSIYCSLIKNSWVKNMVNGSARFAIILSLRHNSSIPNFQSIIQVRSQSPSPAIEQW